MFVINYFLILLKGLQCHNALFFICVIHYYTRICFFQFHISISAWELIFLCFIYNFLLFLWKWNFTLSFTDSTYCLEIMLNYILLCLIFYFFPTYPYLSLMHKTLKKYQSVFTNEKICFKSILLFNLICTTGVPLRHKRIQSLVHRCTKTQITC